MSIYLLATLDTKGPEAELLRDLLVERGAKVTVVDVGCLDQPSFEPDVKRDVVFQCGGAAVEDLIAQGDRGAAVTAAAAGAAGFILQELHAGRVDGVIGLGGSAGTTIGTAAMSALPLEIPKVMVSTLASGQVRPWVGDKNILMFNSVVDIAGVNRISRLILRQAAGAILGSVDAPGQNADDDRPLIAATMFGVTTPCVQHAREILEQAGYEVLVFHATGNGGQAMESLIRDGMIAGVLDITTTELADELVGGVLSAGPTRLTAAAECGVPQVVSVGATDMVNFGTPDSIPDKFRDRHFYQHNPTVTLMRTTADECAAIGQDIREKLSSTTAPACLMLPLRGVSAIDVEGQPFDDPAARNALLEQLRSSQQETIELDLHINDPAFAEAAANKLLALIQSAKPE